jgi:zinc D-Ala-D-Ala dipeptidase
MFMTIVKFEFITIKESDEPLVDLSKYNFILEPSYFNQGLSPDQTIYIRKSIAEKLNKIQNNLKIYKFKIWDGYRSREVQNNIYMKFWKELKEKNPKWNTEKLEKEVGVFVTKPNIPSRIPPHSTGGAIDLTLVDKNEKELDMGTVFDYFGKEASSLFYEENKIDQTIRNNRKILRKVMLSEDFRSDDDEWWHFDYGNQIWAAKLDRPFAFYGEII